MKAFFDKLKFSVDIKAVVVGLAMFLVLGWFVRAMFGTEEQNTKETMTVTKMVRVIGVDGKVLDIHKYNEEQMRKYRLKVHANQKHKVIQEDN